MTQNRLSLRFLKNMLILKHFYFFANKAPKNCHSGDTHLLLKSWLMSSAGFSLNGVRLAGEKRCTLFTLRQEKLDGWLSPVVLALPWTCQVRMCQNVFAVKSFFFHYWKEAWPCYVIIRYGNPVRTKNNWANIRTLLRSCYNFPFILGLQNTP